MDYDVVITNGTLLSADGRNEGRRRDPRRNDRGRGPGSGRAGRCRYGDHRCHGPPGHPGRRRRARPSRAPLLRHGLERRLEHGHPRGGAGRRDHGDRLRHSVRRGEPRSTPSTTGWPGPSPRRASITASISPSPTGIATGPRWRSWSAMGCPTFKEFMIYASEGWQADDRAIYNTLERCRELGAMLLVHAESSRVLDELIARHHTPELMRQHGARLHADDPSQLHRGRGDPACHHLGRGHRRPALHRPHVDRRGNRPRQGRPGSRRRRLRRDLCAVPRARRLGLRRARRPSLRLLPADQEEERPGAALEGPARRARSR